MATKKADAPKPGTEKALPKSYLDPAVQQRIKVQTRQTWERASASRGLNQADLARALKVSTSGISKLLNDDKGHPWTPLHLKAIAGFLKLPPADFLGQEDRVELQGLFEGFQMPSPDEGFQEECSEAIKLHFRSAGISPTAARLSVLAGKLSAKLEGKHLTREIMQAEIQALIMRDAAGL